MVVHKKKRLGNFRGNFAPTLLVENISAYMLLELETLRDMKDKN